MAQRLHRTQILLEPEQHRQLAGIATSQGRSISEVVREMVRTQLQDRERTALADLQRHLDALQAIRQHREMILMRRGGKPLNFDVVELIDRMREERDERNLSPTRPRRH